MSSRIRGTEVSRALDQVHADSSPNGPCVTDVHDLEASWRKRRSSLENPIRNWSNQVPRVLLVYLIAASLELRNAVLPATRMTRVVVTDGGMAIETQRYCVSDVRHLGVLGVKVGDFDSYTSKLSAKTAVPCTPEKHADLVFFPKLVPSLGHSCLSSRPANANWTEMCSTTLCSGIGLPKAAGGERLARANSGWRHVYADVPRSRGCIRQVCISPAAESSRALAVDQLRWQPPVVRIPALSGGGAARDAEPATGSQ